MSQVIRDRQQQGYTPKKRRVGTNDEDSGVSKIVLTPVRARRSVCGTEEECGGSAFTPPKSSSNGTARMTRSSTKKGAFLEFAGKKDTSVKQRIERSLRSASKSRRRMSKRVCRGLKNEFRTGSPAPAVAEESNSSLVEQLRKIRKSTRSGDDRILTLECFLSSTGERESFTFASRWCLEECAAYLKEIRKLPGKKDVAHVQILLNHDRVSRKRVVGTLDVSDLLVFDA